MHASGLAPRWASAPGETIASALSEREMSRNELATGLGLDIEQTDRLLRGDLSITISLARRLADIVGGSTRFWMTREAQYLDDLARVKADRWSQEFPVAQMASFGWITRPKTWRDRIEECLRFFDVEDVDEWDDRYGKDLEAAHFRTSATFELESAATTAWFRAGERAAEHAPDLPPYDAGVFESAMPAIRQLTRVKEPERFVPELIERCASAGVRVVLVRAPKGCPASGAARLHDGQPMIQLSARHLTDDHLWFTFFHEAGHVVRHDLDTAFVDVLDSDSQDDLEQDANDFASGWLMGRFRIGPGAVSRRDIIRAAHANDVAPGVVVGQLQHRGQVRPDQHNGLKRRYLWNGTSLETKQRS